MLVLSRKVGERILLGDDIVVTVLAMQGNRVRIGIEAPDAVRIRRSELTMLDQLTFSHVHYQGKTNV